MRTHSADAAHRSRVAVAGPRRAQVSVAGARRVPTAAGLLSALALLLAALVAVPAPAAAATDSAKEREFLELANDERRERGLAPLEGCRQLRHPARDHSATMADEQRLHHNPDLGSDVPDYRRAGENVGRGGSVASLHGAFMDSEGHRANVLDEGFSQVGVGTDVRDGTIWVTFVFREPNSDASCRAIDGSGSGGGDGGSSAPAPAPEPAPEPEPETPEVRSAPGQQLLVDLTGDGATELLRLGDDHGWHVRHDGREARWGGLPPGDYEHLAADVDGDGAQEAVSFRRDDGAWLVSEHVDGSLETRKAADFGTPSGWEHLAADLTGDGRDEIVSFHTGSGAIWVLRADGDALAAERWSKLEDAAGWEHLVADVEGDGQDELVSYHEPTGDWHVGRAVEERTGWFTTAWSGLEHERLGAYNARTGWEHLVADVDGDGRDQLVSFHTSAGNWYVADLDGQGLRPRRASRFEEAAGWQHVAGDVDGDGGEEILSYREADGSWRLSAGDGDSLDVSDWGAFSPRDGWLAHLVGDVTGDGRMDVASFRSGTGWRLSSAASGSGGLVQQDL